MKAPGCRLSGPRRPVRRQALDLPETELQQLDAAGAGRQPDGNAVRRLDASAAGRLAEAVKRRGGSAAARRAAGPAGLRGDPESARPRRTSSFALHAFGG